MERSEARNSLLVRVSLSLSSRSSIPSTGLSWESALRRSQTFWSSSFSRRSSSFRVPDCSMLMVGKTRLSISRRSRWTSMLPVPLNSSKITSSIRLPVSTMAVAMIVSEPPSSMFRAVAKKRCGLCRAVAARQAGERVEQNDTVPLVLPQPLGLLDHHVGDLDVPLRRLVEGGGDHLALHGPLHVGDFLRALVDEQDDEVDLGMVRRDRVGDRLQHHRFACPRRGHDHAPLALADR